MKFSDIGETSPKSEYEEAVEMTTLLCLRVRADHLNFHRLACWHSIEHVFDHSTKERTVESICILAELEVHRSVHYRVPHLHLGYKLKEFSQLLLI